ncbi:MAG: TolC family protein, partial [Firmicutes bacterium]|nr:TolC family protein [Bacillota bacterium]
MRKILVPVLVLFLLIGMLPSSCLADTAASPEVLTVEEAIDLAYANRNDVKLADLTLQAANISGDIAWDNASEALQAAEIDNTGQFIGGIDSWNQVYTSEYNLQVARKNYDTKRESVKFSVYQQYYNVVTALDSTDAQRLSSQQADQKLKIAELRYLLGMDTKATLYSSQQQAASAAGNYATTQQSLDQKYIALMEYIGKPVSSRPALVRELTYTPIVVSNPEQKFAQIVKDSPSVWLAKKSLDLTQETSDSSVGPEGDLTDINLEKADISIITTRDAMIDTTRSLYYNILSVEEAYATAVASAKSADEALRVAKLMYEVGLGIKLDVTAAEIAANSAHQTLDSLSYQHAILAMAFEKPWA